MTCCTLRGRRITALVVACLVFGLGGSTYLVAIMSVDMQQEFRLSQTAVEVILGAGFVADNLGYPWGLLLEQISERTALLLAMLIGSIPALLLYAADYFSEFFADNWWMLAVLWASVCSSFIIAYLVCVSVTLSNFPRAYHGRVMGLLHATWWLGQGLFNYIYVLTEDPDSPQVGRIFVILAVGIFVFKGLGAIYVRTVPLGLLEQQLLELKEDEDDTEVMVKESWSDILGVELLWNLDFHLLAWGFICGSSVSIMYMVNVASICQALSLDDLDEVILPYAPLSAMLVSFVIGFTSDVTLTRIPRETYLAVTAAAQCFLFALMTFYSQSSAMFVASVFLVYSFNAGYFIITSAILGDYFGTRHFKRNYGIIRMFTALVSFILVTVYGEMFDHMANTVDGECVGIMCVYDMFIISAVLSCISFIAFVLLHRRYVRGTPYQEL